MPQVPGPEVRIRLSVHQNGVPRLAEQTLGLGAGRARSRVEWSETTPRTCSDGAASVSEVFQDIEAELQRVTPTTDGKHAAIRVELTYGHSERPSYAHEDPCARPAGTGYSLRLQRQVVLAKGGVTSITLEGGIVLTLERVQ